MLWTFTRKNELLTIETRFDDETKEYVQRFKDMFLFQSTLAALEEQLDDEKWPSDGLVALRDGWKI